MRYWPLSILSVFLTLSIAEAGITDLRTAAKEAGPAALRKLCLEMVAASHGHQWDKATTQFQWEMLKATLPANVMPELTEQQVAVLVVLDKAPDRGWTADELFAQFTKYFNVTKGNMVNVLERMKTRGNFVASHFKDDVEKFAITAHGLWQLENLFGFYQRLRQKATVVRRQSEAMPMSERLQQRNYAAIPVPEVGHTKAVLLAHLVPGETRELFDYAIELVSDSTFGTPGGVNDVYSITKEMEEEGFVRRTYFRADAPQDCEITSKVKGERALATAFSFYDKAKAVWTPN